MTTSSPNDELLPRPGDLVAGRYRVEREIGRGGMGVVVAAWDERQRQRVAIKVLVLADQPEAAARFLNEARSAARIQHENVVRCLEVGRLENGAPYMVLELLEGLDLEQILRRGGRLPVTTAVDYVLQALGAMAQAHALGIVHRDLKPENLFLARQPDGSAAIKVLDFGVAKSAEGGASLAHTMANSLLGSPYYMSPEQFRSARTVDRRADIWSIGVILYELLGGVCPFRGEELVDLFEAIAAASPVPLTRIRPDCPPGLEAVVRRCLSANREQRYDGAPELAEALAPFAEGRALASLARLRAAQPAAVSSAPAALGSAPAATSLSPVAVTTGPITIRPRRSPSPGLSRVVAVMTAAILGGIGVGAGAYLVEAPRSARGAAAPAAKVEERPAPPAQPAPASPRPSTTGANAVPTPTPAPASQAEADRLPSEGIDSGKK